MGTGPLYNRILCANTHSDLKQQGTTAALGLAVWTIPGGSSSCSRSSLTVGDGEYLRGMYTTTNTPAKAGAMQEAMYRSFYKEEEWGSGEDYSMELYALQCSQEPSKDILASPSHQQNMAVTGAWCGNCLTQCGPFG